MERVKRPRTPQKRWCLMRQRAEAGDAAFQQQIVERARLALYEADIHCLGDQSGVLQWAFAKSPSDG